MALHFYIGGAGSGKSHELFTRIIEESVRERAQRFLILVPEQSTMETQRQIVNLHPCGGILNIEVLSMTRLASRVFTELGARREELLEEIGKTFLLEKIALEERGRLVFFGDLVQKPEFLAQMKAAISEFMLYGVTPEQLEDIARGDGDPSGSEALSRKLLDLALLYREFQHRLQGSYLTAEELPAKFAALVGQSAFLKDCVIALDGFTGFTPLQLVLIEKLMRASRDMHVTVTMDAGENPFRPYVETELFSLSFEMVRSLTELAKKTKTPLSEPFYAGNSGRHAQAPSLKHLEQTLFRRQTPYRKVQEETPAIQKEIRLFACSSMREEVRRAGREICRMVRSGGLRYRDFAIVTADLTTYGRYVREIFPELGIPFFIDEKRALRQNPFMEYLRAALEAVTEQYAYNGMFRMLKSGMTEFDRTEIDCLENYVLAMGIRGKGKWHEPFIRHYRGEDAGELPRLNELRLRILELLDPLAEVMARRDSTVREKTAALYEFCVRSHAQERLKNREDRCRQMGRNDLAREYAQVWPYIVSFLDKLVALLGPAHIPMKDYRALIEAGFAEGRLAIIPPGNDQVMVGDMERSRLGSVRVLFFVGVNEGLVPKAAEGSSVLTWADREVLHSKELPLKPTPHAQIYIDRFYLYLTLTKPSGNLILSWCANTPSGESARPSSLIALVRKTFPDLSIEEESGSIAEEIEREGEGVSLLLQGLSHLDQEIIGGDFKELFSYYLTHPLYEGRMRKLLRAASARREADVISRAAARALYGNVLQNSASRLERFCSCRYAHFLEFGMKLKPRQEYGFTGLDMGSILHRALELFQKQLHESGISWASLASDEGSRNMFASESLIAAAREYGSGIFADSARDRYQLTRMERLMREAVWAEAEQLDAGDFTPFSAEEAFQGLDLSHLRLENGAAMQLRGRIDRIDTFELDGRTYVEIVDYKTGAVTFDLTEVYFGLQMQLVVYLSAAMELLKKEGKQVVPAGIFYYPIKDPVIPYQAGEREEDTRRRLLGSMRANGVVLGDRAFVGHFDRKLQPGLDSDVLPLSLKKDGDFAARSTVLEEEEFRTLCDYVKKTIYECALAITEGSAEMNPYYYKSRTACDFCHFKGICGFDSRTWGSKFRRLPAYGSDEVLARMAGGE